MPAKQQPKRAAAQAGRMSTAEFAVAALIAHGIDTVYALPGVHNDPLFDALFKSSDRIRTVHTRHEQGAAYMALGAALATGKPQTYSVVPGPGLLNSSAALLTAHGMNAPVLALVGQIPQAAIGRGLGHLHEIRDQAGIISRLVDFSARIREPNEAAGLVAQAFRAMASGRPGPAVLECAMDVWGKSAPARSTEPPLLALSPPLDENTIEEAARRLGACRRPLIIVGGGAQDAAAEVSELSRLLQAPVLAYRRGRGVLDSRNPLSVTLPLGRELWGEADVVLAVGTRLFSAFTQWGIDRELAIIRIDANPEEAERYTRPAAALTGDAKPILRRLAELLPAQRRASGTRNWRTARPGCARAWPSWRRKPASWRRSGRNCPRTAFSSMRSRKSASQRGSCSRSTSRAHFCRPGIRTIWGGDLQPRSARHTRGATYRWCRSPATAAFSLPPMSWRPPCITALRSPSSYSTMAPSAMCGGSRRSNMATG
jgi:thiamine pyrophosphate-dependent acetolactate synthase large subunit-like protein